MRDGRKFSLSFVLVLFVLFTACKEDGPQVHIYAGEALGTTYQLKFYSSGNLKVQKGLDSIFEVINKSMSTYQSDSDISKINSGDTSVKVDENFRQVFNLSEKIYKESDGYFDPTVGNLVNAYGFGPEHQSDNLNRTEIDSMLQYVGFNKLKLTADHKILKQQPEIYLDFNAIAKGYTVDVIALFLDKKGVQDYLIEVGGELVAKGINRSKNNPWIVAIDDPFQTPKDRTFQATLKLENRAMATSGNYRKFRVDTVTGERFVHTINPIAGKSEKSNLLSASVLAENCASADAYATAFMALGLERSKEMLERLENVEVYFIYAENNQVNVFASEGFKKVLLTD
jgi:thiamine biosynthesis lipoprotein